MLNSLWDWEPVDTLKPRSGVVSFTLLLFIFIFSVKGERHRSICDEGYGQRKQAEQKGENCNSRRVTE